MKRVVYVLNYLYNGYDSIHTESIGAFATYESALKAFAEEREKLIAEYSTWEHKDNSAEDKFTLHNFDYSELVEIKIDTLNVKE